MTRQLDFDDTFSFAIKIQKSYGSPSCFEPYSESFLGLIRSQFGFIAVTLILMYYLFSNCYYMATVTVNKQFDTETGMMEEMANKIACTGFTLIGFVKMLVLAYDRNLLAETLRKMRASWKKQVGFNPEYRDVYEKSLNPVVKFTTYAAITNIVMVSLFNFLPILEMAADARKSGYWTCKLPYKIWYPFDGSSGWRYYFVYSLEVFVASLVAVTNSGFNSMFCLLTVHLSTQMRLLGRSLQCMIRSDKDAKKTPRLSLADLVQCHEQLLEYKKTIEVVFSGTIFVVFAGASILICLQGIIMTTSSGFDAVKFFLFFVSILLEIFFLCYYGDEVMQSSSAIGSSAYECLWYDVKLGGDEKFRKTLIPIIARSQKPVVLMAWLFWPITINTFGMILRTSWSYFTLLNAIYN